jgi:DUF4097 and DUF4098 domain-containing protein YvlB
MLAIVIIAIAVSAVVAVVATTLFFGQSLSVTTKSIPSYSTPVSSDSNNPSSMTIVDTNGAITITPWSQNNLLINGTATSRGFGTNPDSITYIETNNGGDIVFHAIFPATVFLDSATYTVDINVYTPTTAKFKSVQTSTVNGDIHVFSINASNVVLTDTNGAIQAPSIASTSLTLTDTNGSIDFTCASCTGITATSTNGAVTANLESLSSSGSYTMTSTNGNINLKLPTTASARITANTTNGGVSSSGLNVQVTNHSTVILGTGTVTSTVTLTTTNGSITVTGS